jgi:uncharacterized membrane protein
MAEELKTSEVKEGMVWGILAYVYIFCLVPLLFKRENKFALFHGRQGLVIFLATLFINFGVKPIVPLLGNVLIAIFAALSIVGIYKVIRGEYWEIPVVSDIATKTNI